MQAPTNPTAPIDDTEKSPNPISEAPPTYNSHYQPGPPAPVGYPIAGYPGPGPMGFPGLNQPGGFPIYQSGGPPAVYQPGINVNPIQPPQIPWMPGPPPPPNCPPGLEYLSQLDKILVHQQFQILDLITGFESNNRYEVKNNMGQMVYMVLEDTDDITRNAYHSIRPFVLRVVDCMGQEIMRMQRPLRYTCCCFCCSSTMQELEVQSPPGVPLGYIMQQGVFFATNFRIENEKKEHVLNIDGPCKAQCCSDTIFQIRSMDGINIGSIRRQWPGAAEAEIADIDNYEITFPLDLNVTLKAMVFAATFLIDFMFFEHSPRDDRQHDNY
ncbi:phospholipid scramblase 4 [Phascolarctos cinereus]|uniref:Phospholipid scramblase n=1 Tax=Phascolarctos cinereus TaxID=38626 RepID=A0A6P5JT83_PHACI|nr:phospholipid scramblase 4-like isoform X1 [Phascolarctos cinereus]XP_020836599.1 phospholipid scramblase 4-like isoform X1 [Phascolarctos cinereus]XP_020836600.1 phospholipid scramblase 4-like isoform X1 [Phascolarctos cinereus]XP_020836601.1 phospholipid scramblase 4-like isoform X1 [Phascolarctos cinereus]XP_020836602.1 phospholipid scramblase 4-like isoform X1 [Phascolarctos cinereus]XP_020836603.1 phospholipid scramblase 4-like isoform X1 [Phascolarctos cinereus]XP_020836604.1 phosphol